MESNKNSIFKVLTPDGSGTSFLINNVDFIVTNWHVVDGFKHVALEDSNQNRYLANVIMVNNTRDIAFLECPKLQDIKSSIKIDTNIDINSGDEVYSLGYPYGLPFTINKGIISSIKHIMNGKEFIQIDAAINPGNSGGPIVDKNNNVVAISTSKFSDADNIGFGIPAKELLQEIENYKFSDYKFRVKCNSCGNYIENRVSYCNNCGANIDKSLFTTKESSYLSSFVNEMLTDFGLNPYLCIEGDDYWRFFYGDCSIRIFKYNDDKIYMTTPLSSVAKENLLELFSYLTSDKEEPFSFHVSENVIYISYRIHKNDIYVDSQKERIKANMQNFIKRSKELQLELLQNYGCEKSPDSKE